MLLCDPLAARVLTGEAGVGHDYGKEKWGCLWWSVHGHCLLLLLCLFPSLSPVRLV